jgi:predicted PolB exonuclease-like 3'-5' exonuclease
MPMNVLVFDIETVPDVEGARRIWSLDGLSDADVAKVIAARRQQETGGTSEFPRHYLHRIVAISIVLRSDERLKVWSLGDAASPEADLIGRFFEGIDRYSPVLVSWNGGGFDLPVLHYRALLHGVPAPRYWDTGADDHAFRWNNYLNRFHERHTDLMDVLSGYQARAVAPLDQIACLLGFPGKMGMHGGAVYEAYQEGRIEAIRDYCETDVLNTYLVFLAFERMRGQLDTPEWEAECERVRALLRASTESHHKEFLDQWVGVAQ